MMCLLSLNDSSKILTSGKHTKMKQRNKKQKLPKRNYLVALVVKKSGAGKHRDRKRESKEIYDDRDI